MAGLGYKHWAANDILSAADINSYLADQSVMRFSNAAARTAAILTPTQGMVTYLDSTGALEVYSGSAWVAVVADGSITNAKLASGIDAAKITTGTLPSAQLPTIPTANLGQGNWNMGVATLTTTYVTASQAVTCADFNASASVTATSSLYGPGTYNQTNSGRAVYIASNGLFGIGASSERFKENIEDAQIDSAAVLNVKVRNFTYKPDFSDDQSVQIGVIAEELVALGLSEFVFFDADGVPDGVAYERLALALIPVVQQQAARLDSVEDRLSKLEK
jgi:hypothetical protein